MKRINPDFNAAARTELADIEKKFVDAIERGVFDNPTAATLKASEKAWAEAARIADTYRDKFFDQFESLSDFEYYLETADPKDAPLEFIYAESLRFIHEPNNEGINPMLKDAGEKITEEQKAEIDADFERNYVAPYRAFLKKLTP